MYTYGKVSSVIGRLHDADTFLCVERTCMTWYRKKMFKFKKLFLQNLLLHMSKLLDPGASVVVFAGHGQQLVCPHCGW